jgi:hypothetical protein
MKPRTGTLVQPRVAPRERTQLGTWKALLENEASEGLLASDPSEDAPATPSGEGVPLSYGRPSSDRPCAPSMPAHPRPAGWLAPEAQARAKARQHQQRHHAEDHAYRP